MVKILEKIRKFSKEESGASMVMVVLSLVVIFGFTAFAVDFGNAYTTKVKYAGCLRFISTGSGRFIA